MVPLFVRPSCWGLFHSIYFLPVRVCAKSDAATDRTGLGVFGLLSKRAACEATFGDVCLLLAIVQVPPFPSGSLPRHNSPDCIFGSKCFTMEVLNHHRPRRHRTWMTFGQP